jgi:predicted dehydrogenase
MKTIKAGIIGTGFIGPAHVEALRRLGSVDVVGLAEESDAVAKEKAAALNIPRPYGNYRDLLGDSEIQTVHICSPNHLHYEMAKAALEAGKHVVCEKPLAISVDQAQILAQLADKTKLVHAINFNVRYYPLMRQVRTMVERGEMGEVFAVHGSYLQDWLFHPTDYNWRLETALSGQLRAVADIGTHWIDLVTYVTGLEITSVFADMATFHPIRKKPRRPVETYSGKLLAAEDYEDIPITTEDYAAILFRFANGGRGMLTLSQVAAGRKNRCAFEIDGSKQAVAFDSETPNALWIGRRDGNNEIMIKDPSLAYPDARALMSYPGGHTEGFPDTFKQLYREVYAAVSDGMMPPDPVPFPTFHDGLRELIVCEKIQQSHQEERWIDVAS